MSNTKAVTFEEAYARLEECSRNASKEGMSLDETIRAFEEGVASYKLCADLLDNAEQRIRQIEKETGELLDV